MYKLHEFLSMNSAETREPTLFFFVQLIKDNNNTTGNAFCPVRAICILWNAQQNICF